MGIGEGNQVIEEILVSVEAFAGTLDKFIGVFDATYAGGDFCAGITFGMEGMSMIEKLAQTLYEEHIKSKAKRANAKRNPGG